jgi:hypothetical protein
MAKGNVLPQLDLGGRKVPQLRSRNSGSKGSGQGPLRDVVPEHGSAVLPNGGTASSREGFCDSCKELQEARRLHLALVLPDLKVFGSLKDSIYVLKPQGWEGDIQVHVLLQRKGKSKQEVVFAFALTQLGLVEPSVANLQYPEELELGWSDSTAPIKEEKDGTT